ncbi:unnamed protein product [Nesidiocoris tenuis]|uniref:Uncharacterized protein n=1 Tax=Nesidiocoris tenuis TaxID=355587 RepID=A0A6H5H956_9HEMI|nr:unnamed protein product [Nesidiocoris tenuis]
MAPPRIALIFPDQRVVLRVGLNSKAQVTMSGGGGLVPPGGSPPLNRNGPPPLRTFLGAQPPSTLKKAKPPFGVPSSRRCHPLYPWIHKDP